MYKLIFNFVVELHILWLSRLSPSLWQHGRLRIVLSSGFLVRLGKVRQEVISSFSLCYNNCCFIPDMEPDDLSLLKVSLNPVKERSFPARGALKKKTRQKRGKRLAIDKNSEPFDTNPSVRSAGRTTEHAHNSRGRYDTQIETPYVTPDTCVIQSWREKDAEQSWRLDDSANSKCSNPPSSSESEFSDSDTGQARRLR